MIGGDFNMILNSHERSRENFLRACMKEFKTIMDRCDLMDLPVIDGK